MLRPIARTCSLLCLTALCTTAFAADLNFAAVENWIKPAPGSATIGAAHGDVAVSSNGDVYVSINGPVNGGLQVFDSSGKYLHNVPNAPNDLHGFVIRKIGGEEFILGASVLGHSVLKMKLDGKITMKFDASQIPDDYKNLNAAHPVLLTAVDVAPDGRIFVVDGYGRDFIHIVSADGKYLDSFGGRQAPYNFTILHKICIDTRFDPPQILGTDRENRRVVRMSLDGDILQVIPEMKRPAAVAVFGDLAVIAEIEGRLSFLDREGNTVMTLGENDIKEQTATNKVKPEDWRPGILTAPHGLDFDTDGNLLVSEFNEFGRIVRYDLNQ